jgi:KUP system potassium uptake protein
MEAAYGLAITLSMIMTTILLSYYLVLHRTNLVLIYLILIVYLTIEFSFFWANLQKFHHGGYVTIIIAGVLSSVMVINYLGKKIRSNYIKLVHVSEFSNILNALRVDKDIPKYATNLVYLTNSNIANMVEYKAIHSIIHRRPKRADIYWFVHVNVIDEPYKLEYKVHYLDKERNIIRIDFNLGFRNEPRINVLMKQVVVDLMTTKEIDITNRYESLQRYDIKGDFEYVLIEKELSYDNDLPVFEGFILNLYELLKKVSLSEDKAFGLDSSSVTVEHFPMIINPIDDLPLKRI